MEKSKLKEFYGHLIILGVLFFSQLYCLYSVYTSDASLHLQHYLGFAATAISAVLLFVRPNWSFYALGLTLVLGVENILGFTPPINLAAVYAVDSPALPAATPNLAMYLLLLWAYFSHNRLRQLGQLLFTRNA